MISNEKYRKFNGHGNYLQYSRERDEHLYQLWKSGKTKTWIADYIDRSQERARQLVKKFEIRAKNEDAIARVK